MGRTRVRCGPSRASGEEVETGSSGFSFGNGPVVGRPRLIDTPFRLELSGVNIRRSRRLERPSPRDSPPRRRLHVASSASQVLMSFISRVVSPRVPRSTAPSGSSPQPIGSLRPSAWACSNGAATPSMRASRPPSRFRSWSRISTARAATCRSSSTTARVAGGDLRAGAGARRGDHGPLQVLGLDLVPGTGLLAALHPGHLRRLYAAAAGLRHPAPADVLTPAIGYARNGFPLVERICHTIRAVEALFREHWPTSAAVYLPNGEVPAPGSLFRNPVLADTYERLLKEARPPAATGSGRSNGAPGLEPGIRRGGRGPLLPDAGGHGRDAARPSGVLTGQDMAGREARASKRRSATITAAIAC